MDSRKVTCMAILILAYLLSTMGLAAFEVMGISPYVFMCALFIPVFGVKILIALYLPVLFWIGYTITYMPEVMQSLMDFAFVVYDWGKFPVSNNGMLAIAYCMVFFSRTFAFFSADRIIRKLHLYERMRI